MKPNQLQCMRYHAPVSSTPSDIKVRGHEPCPRGRRGRAWRGSLKLRTSLYERRNVSAGRLWPVFPCRYFLREVIFARFRPVFGVYATLATDQKVCSSPWRKDRPWTPSLILCQCRKSPRFASKGTSANWLCSVWCFTIISTQATLSNGEAGLRMVREQPTTLASLASGCERGGEPT